MKTKTVELKIDLYENDYEFFIRRMDSETLDEWLTRIASDAANAAMAAERDKIDNFNRLSIMFGHHYHF